MWLCLCCLFLRNRLFRLVLFHTDQYHPARLRKPLPPDAQHRLPPPGICAEYAYYLSMPETAETFAKTATNKQKRIFEQSDYAAFFPQYARELFEREITLYPESAVFIKPLIDKLLKQ